MSILLVAPDEVMGDRVRLRGARARRATELASRDGTLRVGLRDGPIGNGTLQSEGADVEVACQWLREPPARQPITVIVALPRPKVLRRVLSTCAMFGVQRVAVIEAWRVDKSYWMSPALEPKAIEAALIVGAEQAHDTRLPQVSQFKRFREFADTNLRDWTEPAAWVAHPAAMDAAPSAPAERCSLAVGPERGFTAYEVARFEEAGFRAIRLGERHLRVEVCVAALLGRVTT